ncbi:MAG: radical SAM family heme chaperone HemW [Muribaculaceae bacterium]|nr:radical SAM family heme chaperone HemW [Muribaculaceae bacterium]
MSAGLYIHVPFCRNKCLYCDFYTGGSRIADWQKYVTAIKNELHTRRNELNEEVSTLYIGGGTPSLIPSENFTDLIKDIQSITGKKEWDEFTIEVNPEDVTPEKISIWKDLGVNRVSVGVQSFNDKELKVIGRKHSAREALEAMALLAKNFHNLSIDLMFGLPGQTIESYRNTLEYLNKIKPQHVSLYSLMLEEGTAMTHLVNNRKVDLPPESEWLKMFQLSNDFLKSLGFERYEISNYALPGCKSIHNYSYWQGQPYLGLGPGAHSYDGKNTRRANPNDLKGYVKFFSERKEKNNEKKFFLEEILNEKELREEFIITRLRTTQGVNLDEFAQKFGEEATNNLFQSSLPFLNSGELKEVDGFLKFTDKGFLISDPIMASLI